MKIIEQVEAKLVEMIPEGRECGRRQISIRRVVIAVKFI